MARDRYRVVRRPPPPTLPPEPPHDGERRAFNVLLGVLFCAFLALGYVMLFGFEGVMR